MRDLKCSFEQSPETSSQPCAHSSLLDPLDPSVLKCLIHAEKWKLWYTCWGFRYLCLLDCLLQNRAWNKAWESFSCDQNSLNFVVQLSEATYNYICYRIRWPVIVNDLLFWKWKTLAKYKITDINNPRNEFSYSIENDWEAIYVQMPFSLNLA